MELDLEFKKVHEGWPALASGEMLPPRWVYEQVRTLETPMVQKKSIWQTPNAQCSREDLLIGPSEYLEGILARQ